MSTFLQYENATTLLFTVLMGPTHPAPGLLPTLPLQIAEQLTAAIIDEQYKPRERLKETELALHYAVSRSTIREALRILETRNLVRILPQRGAIVTGLSRREIEDLFEIRAFLVGLIARRVAADRDDHTIVRLDALLAELQAARSDGRAYAKASAAAAIELARLSQNDHLVQLLTSFAHQIGRYTRLGLLSETRRKRSLQLWSKLFEAIKARNASEAEMLNRRLALENKDSAMSVLEARSPIK
jgi:DNA-binding GntR family transcriptional regulator